MTRGSPEVTLFKRPPHNQRLKLTGRSGHVGPNPLIVAVAAPARSLSALR